MSTALLAVAATAPALYVARRSYLRLLLSKAKHPSLRGHARIARLIARFTPFYEYGEEAFFSSDDAPAEIVRQRRQGFERLAELFRTRAPRTLALGEELEGSISDVAFTNAYRVPFQYRNYVRSHLKVGTFAERSDGMRLQDLDGNWTYDLGGSYGLDVFGTELMKGCIDRGLARVRDLGPVLGPYHPVIADNVRRLLDISGMDEVSFHMSGTEAVMQAARLARYHTGRSHLVRFCGAYHGWWDAVQPGIGNPRPVREVYTLKEGDADTLRVLRKRRDIACVLVNPLQALHPNASAPSDSTLVASDRKAHFDRAATTRWLKDLREICTERGIALVFDEVFLGFRLARGGAQEYFGVRADLVTYGKTVGGGLPIGVVCGKREWMRRFREDRPTDICFARGTFNSHPLVMATMNELLRHVDSEEGRASYRDLDATWNRRARALNTRLEAAGLPLRVANLLSVWTTLFTQPSRYNWMLQYYLRAEGLSLPWIGSSRFIFSHSASDAELQEVMERIVSAAQSMQADGWWWKNAALDDRGIKRRILRELMRAGLGIGAPRSSDRSARPS